MEKIHTFQTLIMMRIPTGMALVGIDDTAGEWKNVGLMLLEDVGWYVFEIKRGESEFTLGVDEDVLEGIPVGLALGVIEGDIEGDQVGVILGADVGSIDGISVCIV